MTKLALALALALAATATTAVIAPQPAAACGGYSVSESDRVEWAVTSAIAARNQTLDRIWVTFRGTETATARTEWHNADGTRRVQSITLVKRDGTWRVHRWGFARAVASTPGHVATR